MLIEVWMRFDGEVEFFSHVSGTNHISDFVDQACPIVEVTSPVTKSHYGLHNCLESPNL